MKNEKYLDIIYLIIIVAAALYFGGHFISSMIFK